MPGAKPKHGRHERLPTITTTDDDAYSQVDIVAKEIGVAAFKAQYLRLAALDLPGLVLAPIEPAIAVDSVRLPGRFHADPADRMIVATARRCGVPLVTADRAILSYAANGRLLAVDAAA